ncbi:regulatory subunit of cyclin-dependent kinase [Gilbertella persicaria]|uniref:Cyclin-dependent kinases regulatory subunit n=1 Tax=Rhizopus stolonifer TaxID=4846 RepID=A0A367KTA8_RHIST|nr:regulatory subunit of cyclin-dependent kinase [Gilbertella persicaria]KAI8053133.1 regulatory subunit of cyclin-dependent kinase [Gilbertella persicaria]RCI05360.1 hypothetical protein CU098_010013 [Rhizopus stolonifer]
MNNDENQNTQTKNTGSVNHSERNDYGGNLMPKTIHELQEIQARGRKLLIKKKYIKRNRNVLPEQIKKTEEELRLEKIQKQKDIDEYSSQIVYSNYYFDDEHEYKHVVLPKNLANWLPKPPKLLEPAQWIELGVYQTSGWEHYMIYAPEPHVLLFRREKNYLAKYGDNNPQVPESLKEQHIRQSQEYIQKQKQKYKEAERKAKVTAISDIPPQEHIPAANYRPMTRSSTAAGKQ